MQVNEKLGPVKSSDLIQIIERPVTNEFSNFKFNDVKHVKKPDETSKAAQNSVNEFSNFKFPEETKGKTMNNFNELYEIERVSKEACERHEVLIDLDCEEVRNSNEEGERMDTDLPEDVFEITLKDLKSMLGDAKKVQSEENILMTRQMRELEQVNFIISKPSFRFSYREYRANYP